MKVLTYRLKQRPDLCGFKGCTGIGLYKPVLVCPQPMQLPPVELVLNIKVCEGCKRLPREAYLADEGWKYMIRLLELEKKYIPPKGAVEVRFDEENAA